VSKHSTQSQALKNQVGLIAIMKTLGKLNLTISNNENVHESLYTQMKNIIKKIKLNKNSWPFHSPVDASQVTDYYSVIKEPMGNILIIIQTYKHWKVI
jgi:hypothetical protein